jgi:hypothetical protein
MDSLGAHYTPGYDFLDARFKNWAAFAAPPLFALIVQSGTAFKIGCAYAESIFST